MYSLSVLPVGLIALLLSSPALCAEPTTPADPFYHIAKLAHRRPEPPVCCLKPLESNELYEPVEEILSFEEWKSRQEQAFRQEEADGSKSRGSAAKTNTVSDATQGVRDEAGNAEGPPPLEPPAPPPPHFRVPLTDRFNYASLDCSARVHYAHKSARSASSLLSSKKDRYMLSPCNTPGEDKFVVVELCEDIRIDTVQLANFEFFSGVFKDFSVSVARTYTTDPEGWTSAGMYRAKNIRGIQSFHPPTSLRDFYRFIRIDFHSYYGNEYYCPISLLRVYGLTHLEQWKWEVWEAEYKAKSEAQASLRAIASAPAPPPAAGAGVEEDVRVVSDVMDKEETTSGDQPSTTSRSESDATVGSEQKEVTTTSVQSESITTTSITDELFRATEELGQTQSSESFSRDSSLASSSIGNTPVSSESTIPSSSTSSTSAQSISEPSPSEFHVRNASTAATQSFNASSSHSAQKLNTTNTSQVSATQIPTIIAHESRGVPAVTATGESIYRTIMTRLSILEANSSLYLRYVEEQTRSLRDTLTRLEEDVGRLDGLSKATTQSFQKIINEMDRQRRRLEREHGELQTRVDFLTDEVIIEKRLGIAQLCLLLVVLVFMALTRGSRGEPFIPQVSIRRRDALREWGRRQLSSFSSGEWASKLRSGSPSHIPGDFVESPIPVKPEKVRFPVRQAREAGDETPRGSTSNLIAPSSSKGGRTLAEIRAPHPRQFLLHPHSHRPRTPTSTGFNLHAQVTRSAGLLGAPSTPSQGMARPRLRRANSHSTPAPSVGNSKSMVEGTMLVSGSGVLASAKKWAKSAHWHEIRRRSPRRAGETSIPAGSTPMSTIAQVKSDQENAKDAGGLPEDFKEPLSDILTNSYPRVPLSTSPLQNRSRRQHKADLERLHLEQLQSDQSSKGGPKIIDLDTESESWEDTDADADADPLEVD